MGFTRHSKTAPAPQAQAASAPPSKAEESAKLAKAFEESRDYNSGRRRRLRDFYTGDWWLNVDYVEDYDRIQAC